MKPQIDIRPVSPTLNLLRVIGSPLMYGGAEPSVDIAESSELFKLAIKNKIPLLYLEALKKQGRLELLSEAYVKEQEKYSRFVNAISRLSGLLDVAGIYHAVFKTIKPYPAVPVDIDLLVMGDDDMYKKTVEILLRAGYPPQTPGIINPAGLTDDEAYGRAVDRLTTPTYGKMHVSPTGTDFLDPEYNIDIDLQKDLALSYIVYLDKAIFNGNIIKTNLKDQRVSTLAPEFDLLSVMAHSVMEQLFLLGEFYSFLYRLADMDKPKIEKFVNLAEENRLKLALRAFTCIAAQLHETAFNTTPPEIQLILAKVGYNTRETKSLTANNLHAPHRYRLKTLAEVFFEKIRERKFRRGVLTQMRKTLKPRLIRLVIRELVDRSRRETYLEGFQNS